MTRVATKIGPADHGKPMSLTEFDRAEGQQGFRYELNRGVISVMEVPKPKHLMKVIETRNQLVVYQLAHPEAIFAIAGSMECKILLFERDSERHPDLCVYKTPPPSDDHDVWSRWVPELVVEVVSLGSKVRDYIEKREEYLAFGVKEYWIIDAERQEMLALRRVRGKWKETVVALGEKYETPLLPGLSFDLDRVFAA